MTKAKMKDIEVQEIELNTESLTKKAALGHIKGRKEMIKTLDKKTQNKAIQRLNKEIAQLEKVEDKKSEKCSDASCLCNEKAKNKKKK